MRQGLALLTAGLLASLFFAALPLAQDQQPVQQWQAPQATSATQAQHHFSFIRVAEAVEAVEKTIMPSIPKPSTLPGPGAGVNPITFFQQFVGGLARGIIGILGFLAVLMLVYGGFMYITSGGDPEKAKKGKMIFTYAVVGLLLAAFAFAIVSTIVSVPTQVAEEAANKAALEAANKAALEAANKAALEARKVVPGAQDAPLQKF